MLRFARLRMIWACITRYLHLYRFARQIGFDSDSNPIRKICKGHHIRQRKIFDNVQRLWKTCVPFMDDHVKHTTRSFHTCWRLFANKTRQTRVLIASRSQHYHNQRHCVCQLANSSTYYNIVMCSCNDDALTRMFVLPATCEIDWMR